MFSLLLAFVLDVLQTMDPNDNGYFILTSVRGQCNGPIFGQPAVRIN